MRTIDNVNLKYEQYLEEICDLERIAENNLGQYLKKYLNPNDDDLNENE